MVSGFHEPVWNAEVFLGSSKWHHFWGVFGFLGYVPFVQDCLVTSDVFFRNLEPGWEVFRSTAPSHWATSTFCRGSHDLRGGWTTTMPVIETRHVFYSWGIPAFFLEPGFLLVHVNKDLFRVRGLFHRFLWWRSHKIPLVGIGGVEICANFGWQLQGFLNQIPSLKLT